MAISDDTVVVGAWQEDSSSTGVNSAHNNLAGDAGAAYVFFRNGSTWTHQAYLKASNTGVGDLFGVSVAIHNDTLLVGAPYEDSGTVGVNTTPDENALNAGAAYVFVRSGSTWTQQAYLKASNSARHSEMGRSVAVSGDTAAIGSPYEDGGPFNSGAAYVYVRSGSTWSQQAYLKAGNPGTDDLFAYRLALSGDTLVAGAWREKSSTTGVNSSPDENAPGAGAAYIFTGLGPVPEIGVAGNGIGIANGDTMPNNADNTDFGSVATFGGNLSRYFFVFNAGAKNLLLTGTPKVVLGGTQAADFAVTTQPSLASLPPSIGVFFQIKFDPIAVGLRSATVSIENNDEDENPFTFQIQGVGLSIAEVWSAENGVSTDLSIPGANGQPNLIHFAFGTDPASPARNTLEYLGNDITPGNIRTAFIASVANAELVRRKDYTDAGLTYTFRFSADLQTWHDDGRIPAVVSDNTTHQVLRLPFPLLPGNVQARFFQVRVAFSP